jgi:hypothetical protein
MPALPACRCRGSAPQGLSGLFGVVDVVLAT